QPGLPPGVDRRSRDRRYGRSFGGAVVVLSRRRGFSNVRQQVVRRGTARRGTPTSEGPHRHQFDPRLAAALGVAALLTIAVLLEPIRTVGIGGANPRAPSPRVTI